MEGQETTGLAVLPVFGMPIFAAGDSLSGTIAAALPGSGIGLRDDDVVVVAQKIVSKSEGRTRTLSSVEPSAAAREAAAASGKDPAVVELIVGEAEALMRVAPGVIIARNKHGHVLANAGIDASNIAPGRHDTVLLWPENPDASARKLRGELEARYEVRLAVIISDSLGRAWRMGTTGTAIGVAGMKPLRDRRGETDLFGRILEATVVGVADEIAAAASLVIGEGAEGTPVAIVRGARYDRDDRAAIGEIVRPRHQDLFQ